MKVISVCAAKGGTTKTTVALSLAVRASQESARVAMFDLNGDQGDLTRWWILRGQPMNPRLLEVENISRDVEAARSMGFDWLIIDTPPLDLDIIENCIIKSDAIVIPVRTGFFDVSAVSPVVEMCKARKKKDNFKFLLSAVDSKMPKLIDLAMSGLVNEGTVFGTRLRYLQPYILSVSRGRSAAEIDKGCAPEIDHLWAEVKQLAGWSSTARLEIVKDGRAS